MRSSPQSRASRWPLFPAIVVSVALAGCGTLVHTPPTITELAALSSSSESSKPAEPYEITAGPDGNLWFTEIGTRKIGQITPQGVVTEFSDGITGTGDLGGIAQGPDGNLWFTELDGNRIGRITPQGVVTEFSQGIAAGATPFDITAGPDGNLWFTERDGGKIGRITPQGAVTEFSEGISEKQALWGITKGPNGNIWFAEDTFLGEITPQGVITEHPVPASDKSDDSDAGDRDSRASDPSAKADPFSIVSGPDGNIWFANDSTDGVGRMTPRGDVKIFCTSKGFTLITPGPDGNIWGTDADHPGLIRVQPSGHCTTFTRGISTAAEGTDHIDLPAGRSADFDDRGSYPYGIAAGPDGNIWFTELRGNRIGHINP